MLSKINWTEFYSDSIPTFFHGDLQPENILFDSVSNFSTFSSKTSYVMSSETNFSLRPLVLNEYTISTI